MSKADRDKWSLALRQLVDTLKLLDESNAPLEIGAEIDFAIHRLRAAIEGKRTGLARSVTRPSACSNH